MAMGSIDKALSMLKNLPRVSLSNLQPLPGTRTKRATPRGRHAGRHNGRGKSGQAKRNTLPRLGFEGNNTPFYLLIPKEPYYKGHHVRKQYRPVSLLELQRMIDLGNVNPDEPIDMTTICNTQLAKVQSDKGQYGINLTDEGADVFSAQVNLEVQWCNEQAIAAVERNGGIITTKFYDQICVRAMSSPVRFMLRGIPIPRCKLPSADVLAFYSNPHTRGYLADPEEVRQARLQLAQKYGYYLPDLSDHPKREMLMMRKDPRQIWYGLEPGWVINLPTKKILKPTNEQLVEYYRS